jgi:DNA primase
MEILNDSSWNICGKEEGMAIRGYNSKQIDTKEYAPSHIKSVLKEIGLNIVGETGNDFLCYCPFHSNRHTSSFSVSQTSGAFICFNPACGETGTLIDLIKRTMNKNDFQSLRLIANKETEALNNFDEIMQDMLEDKPVFEEFSQEILNRLHSELGSSVEARSYLEHRGINQDSMKHFGLGYSGSMNMVVTPVHSPDGIPIGIVGRSIEGKTFKNSTSLPKSKTLFNIHRAKKIGEQVIVCESNFDAIRIHQAGFPNVVATLGGFLSNEQHSLLNRHFNKIIIMTDADEAGRELGRSISNKLRNKDISWASYGYKEIYPNKAKDAGDLTEEEIKICIKNSISDIEYRSWL